MKKADLRTDYLERRSQISPSESSRLSEQIADRFFDEIDLSTIHTLHIFVRIQKFNEVDTSMICARLWRDHPQIRTAAPRTDFNSNELVSLGFDADTKLIENRWGIREPSAGPVISAEEIDIVLVPGLCFDAHGHRVGYGRGFYDRFLKRTRADCLKIGLCHFEPIDRIDDAHAADIRVDRLITPSAVVVSPSEYR